MDTKQTPHFELDHYIRTLMRKMEFGKADPEVRAEMYAEMRKQVLYRVMNAMTLSLDIEAGADMAMAVATKQPDELVHIVNRALATNDDAYSAAMETLIEFEEEMLATYKSFKKK